MSEDGVTAPTNYERAELRFDVAEAGEASAWAQNEKAND